MQEKMGNVKWRDGHSKKVSKRNTTNQNAVTEIKKAFDRLIRRMDTAK